MLLPRFTIRTLLVIVVVVAIVSLFAGQALSGRAWACGVTAAVLSIACSLGVQAAFFVLCSGFSHLVSADEVVARTSRGGVERSLRPTMDQPLPSGDQSPGEEPHSP